MIQYNQLSVQIFLNIVKIWKKSYCSEYSNNGVSQSSNILPVLYFQFSQTLL